MSCEKHVKSRPSRYKLISKATQLNLEVVSLYAAREAHLWRLMPVAEDHSLDNCRTQETTETGWKDWNRRA